MLSDKEKIEIVIDSALALNLPATERDAREALKHAGTEGAGGLPVFRITLRRYSERYRAEPRRPREAAIFAALRTARGYGHDLKRAAQRAEQTFAADCSRCGVGLAVGLAPDFAESGKALSYDCRPAAAADAERDALLDDLARRAGFDNWREAQRKEQGIAELRAAIEQLGGDAKASKRALYAAETVTIRCPGCFELFRPASGGDVWSIAEVFRVGEAVNQCDCGHAFRFPSSLLMLASPGILRRYAENR